MKIENILQDLEIKPLTKNRRFFTVKNIKNEYCNHFLAFIYEDNEEYSQNIGILYAVNESDLRRDLLQIYNVTYLSERNFENFINWFTKISGAIPLHSTEKILEKFQS